MAKCKGCGAEIIWAKTDKGKNMPFDKKFVQMWFLNFDKKEMHATPISVYQTHWATCPKAKDFRK